MVWLLALLLACDEATLPCAVSGTRPLTYVQTDATGVDADGDGHRDLALLERGCTSDGTAACVIFYRGPIEPRACAVFTERLDARHVIGTANSQEGLSVEELADWDGDGLDEVVVGNPSASEQGPFSGVLYRAGLEAFGELVPGRKGARTGERLVGGVHDLDGEAGPDVLVLANVLGSGGAEAPDLDLVYQGAAPAEVAEGGADGEPAPAVSTTLDAYDGGWAAATGDLDGDGAADLVVTGQDDAGSPDVRVFRGPLVRGEDDDAREVEDAVALATLLPPLDLTVAKGVEIPFAGHGTALGIGRFTGDDDVPDVVVGAPSGLILNSGANETGWVGVYDGRRVLRGGEVEPSCVWTGTGSDDGFGGELVVTANPGLDHDTLLVAAPRARDGGETLGAVFRFSGCADRRQGRGTWFDTAHAADDVLFGREPGDRMGDRVADLGDLNDDGLGDWAALEAQTDRAVGDAGPGRWSIVFGVE